MKIVKINIKFKFLLIFIFAQISSLFAWPPINIFRPSDRLLQTDPTPGQIFDFSVGVEHAFKITGFRETDDVCQLFADCSRDRQTKVNVLQIYQKKQNIAAALKGCDLSCDQDVAQNFFLDDEGSQTRFVRPTGNFEIPYNVMLNARLYFKYGTSLGLFLPFYKMQLTNVCWSSRDLSPVDKGISQKELEQLTCSCGNLNIKGWERTGPGDLIIQARWMQDYLQLNRLRLKMVRAQARLGLVCPTGLKRDEDKLLAFAFGNDGSWGLQFAGGLDLFYHPAFRLGLDAEFMYLFGDCRSRRVKVDCNQTDLLLFTKKPVFREYGLFQHFTVFAEGNYSSLSARLAYQYYKQNENRDFAFSDKINPFIANNFRESLQEWATHSLIGMLRFHIGNYLPVNYPRPTLVGWLKWGFNGKRALLANTFGVMLSVNF